MAKKTGEKQAAEAAAVEPGRAERGRFRAGESGNPRGRPKGSRNRVTAVCADLLGEASEAVMAKVIEQAKQGDGVALKLCVERLLPMKAARDRTVEAPLPDVGKVTDLVAAAAAVIEHAAAGRITLSEAKEFMALLEGQRRLVEMADLAVRIEALEQQTGAAGLAAGAGKQQAELEPDMRARVRVLDRAREQREEVAQ
jgi:hypothetical protein